MKHRTGFRGQPLLALLAVLGGWIGVRTFIWDADALTPVSAMPLPAPAHAQRPASATPDIAQQPVARVVPLAPELVSSPAREAVAFTGATRYPGRPVPRTPRAWPQWQADAPPARGEDFASPGYYPEPPRPARNRGEVPVRVATAHQMMWMAMMAGVPLPAGLGSGAGRAMPRGALGDMFRGSSRTKRWSADGWMFLRRGGAGLPLGVGSAPSTYGASQAGAVLRYRLAPADSRKPTAYLRTTAAMAAGGDKELAFGVSARPIASIPVVAAAEVRMTGQGSGKAIRPAAMAITELPPFPLPYRTRGEAYVQAGYVAGSNATAFADGQVRVDRGVAQVMGHEVRAGGGIWGGVQKGASRLDVGPSATVALGIGQRGSARVAVDWRFRVAGDAAPSSGPALTLSAGF